MRRARRAVFSPSTKILLRSSLCLLLAVPSLHGCGVRAGTTDGSSLLIDYLVQDVCEDSAERAVAKDPASCPDRRDIRVGERTPYILTDYDRRHAAAAQSVN